MFWYLYLKKEKVEFVGKFECFVVCIFWEYCFIWVWGWWVKVYKFGSNFGVVYDIVGMDWNVYIVIIFLLMYNSMCIIWDVLNFYLLVFGVFCVWSR